MARSALQSYVVMNLRLKDLLGPVTRVKKKKTVMTKCWVLQSGIQQRSTLSSSELAATEKPGSARPGFGL